MAQLPTAVSRPPKAGEGEVSLVRGGPFYRAQEATRLIAPNRWDLGRRITFAVAVGWVPLVLITLLFDPHAVSGLVTDYPINARMLVGVPILLAGQLVMETTFRTILGHIRGPGRDSFRRSVEGIVERSQIETTIFPDAQNFVSFVCCSIRP